MSDFEAILTTVAKLGRSFDEQNEAEFASCWAEDGALNWTDTSGTKRVIEPRSEIVARMSSAWKAAPIHSMHFVSLPIIEIEGDTALARYYSLYPMATAEPEAPGFGQYRTELQKSLDGRWLVKRQNLIQHSKARSDYQR